MIEGLELRLREMGRGLEKCSIIKGSSVAKRENGEMKEGVGNRVEK